MRCLIIAAFAVLQAVTSPVSAKRSEAVYSLPAPLIVEPVAGYTESPESVPSPRRGMALHGYFYDNLNEPEWTTAELAEQAEACGDQLQMPTAFARPGRPDLQVDYDIWLISAPPEALYITREIILSGLDACVARTTERLQISRLLIIGGRVTELNYAGGRWGQPLTLPFNRRFDFSGSKLLLPVDMTKMHKRYKVGTVPPTDRQKFGRNIVCFDTSGGLIWSGECRIDERGSESGLLVSSHVFHTSTVDRGLEVEYLKTDILIDGRLFEWDREILLEK